MHSNDMESTGKALMDEAFAVIEDEATRQALADIFERHAGAVYISKMAVKMSRRRRAVDQLVKAGLPSLGIRKHLARHFGLKCKSTAYREIAAAKKRLGMKASL